MTANNQQRRPRRSAPKKSAAPAPSMDFPTLDAIIRMSQTQVEESFKALGVEPRPFHWSEDNQLNISKYAEMGHTGPVDLKALKASALAHHQGCLRTELMTAYITHWVCNLEDGQLIAEVERLSNRRMGESEKRYMKVEELREEVQQLLWPTLLAASTLYVPVTNPLEVKA